MLYKLIQFIPSALPYNLSIKPGPFAGFDLNAARRGIRAVAKVAGTRTKGRNVFTQTLLRSCAHSTDRLYCTIIFGKSSNNPGEILRCSKGKISKTSYVTRGLSFSCPPGISRDVTTFHCGLFSFAYERSGTKYFKMKIYRPGRTACESYVLGPASFVRE